jgi:hypothetical protein
VEGPDPVLDQPQHRPGEIITQGDHGDRFYLIESGKVEVLADEVTGARARSFDQRRHQTPTSHEAAGSVISERLGEPALGSASR